jgi:hypothetical protein
MLTDKGRMLGAIGEMRSEYQREAKPIQEAWEADKTAKQASVEAIERGAKFRTTKVPKDTPERREEADSNLKDEVNRRSRKSGVEPRIVERELVAEQEGNQHLVEPEDLPGAPFFRCVPRGGVRVLMINRAHPFYDQLYMGSGSTPRLRAALEVLLWTLGEAEVDADPGSDRREFYERERGSAWSPYLASALKELGAMTVVDAEPDSTGAEGDDAAA